MVEVEATSKFEREAALSRTRVTANRNQLPSAVEGFREAGVQLVNLMERPVNGVRPRRSAASKRLETWFSQLRSMGPPPSLPFEGDRRMRDGGEEGAGESLCPD